MSVTERIYYSEKELFLKVRQTEVTGHAYICIFRVQIIVVIPQQDQLEGLGRNKKKGQGPTLCRERHKAV